MAELTIRIRDEYMPMLADMAELNWRDYAQQASFIIEQALIAHRAKSDPSVPRRTRRTRTNGTHTLVTGAA